MELYLDCRDGHTWPVSGSIFDQTAYCVAVFELLDSRVSKWRDQQQKDADRKAKAAERQAKAKARRKK